MNLLAQILCVIAAFNAFSIVGCSELTFHVTSYPGTIVYQLADKLSNFPITAIKTQQKAMMLYKFKMNDITIGELELQLSRSNKSIRVNKSNLIITSENQLLVSCLLQHIFNAIREEYPKITKIDTDMLNRSIFLSETLSSFNQDLIILNID